MVDNILRFRYSCISGVGFLPSVGTLFWGQKRRPHDRKTAGHDRKATTHTGTPSCHLVCSRHRSWQLRVRLHCCALGVHVRAFDDLPVHRVDRRAQLRWTLRRRGRVLWSSLLPIPCCIGGNWGKWRVRRDEGNTSVPTFRASWKKRGQQFLYKHKYRSSHGHFVLNLVRGFTCRNQHGSQAGSFKLISLTTKRAI